MRLGWTWSYDKSPTDRNKRRYGWAVQFIEVILPIYASAAMILLWLEGKEMTG